MLHVSKRIFLSALFYILYIHASFAQIDSVCVVAKQEQKVIIAYFYYNGCGACKKMEAETFSDTTIQAMLHNNYVFVKINTLIGEGVTTKKEYNINLHPTILFLDADKQVFHKVTGYISKTQFKELLLTQTKPNDPYNLKNLSARYVTGARDSSLLYAYIYALKAANEMKREVVDDYFASIHNRSDLHTMQLYYDISYWRGETYIPFQSPYFDFVLGHKHLFYPHFDSTQMHVRIILTCYNAIEQAKRENNTVLFESALSELKKYDNTGTLYYKSNESEGSSVMIMTKNMSTYTAVDFYRARDKESYRQYVKERNKLIWNDVDELDNLSWLVAKYSNDTTKLPDAITFAKRSIAIYPNEKNYYTLALLLYKSGNVSKAKKACLESISFSKKSGIPYKEQEVLLQKIEKESQ